MRATIHTCCRARVLGAIVLLALLTPARPALAAPKPLTKAEKERIDAAIKKGVVYLKRSQSKKGTWEQLREAKFDALFGYTILPGLTLLECGVPPSDPAAQKVAALVRKKQRTLDETFTIALAILFLDRLGEAKDEALIQALAVRLLAGQCRDGAWSYRCPAFSERNEKAILDALKKLGPPAAISDRPAPRWPSPGVSPNPSSHATPAESRPSSRSGSATKRTGPGARGKSSAAPSHVIPHPLEVLTVFQDRRGGNAAKPKPRRTYLDVALTENCNTHFALLALWTARRHGVPVDRTLQLVADYFQRTQSEEGAWPYRSQPGAPGSKIEIPKMRSMICIGLLGLATGHALRLGNGRKPQDIRDPRIAKSFVILSRQLGQPTGDMSRKHPDPGLYFLWSVQSVALVYGLPTIDEKDWYRWGAESLVTNQTPKGHWPLRSRDREPGTTNYYGPIASTCFALLFLKQSNLVKPLTGKIHFDPK